MMIAASLIVLLGSKYNMIVIGFCDGLQKDHEHASASLGTQDMTRRISLVFPQHKVSKPSMLTPEMSNKTIHTSNYNVWSHQGERSIPSLLSALTQGILYFARAYCFAC